MFFLENENVLGRVNAVTTESSFSLIHAVALWAGWSTDLSGLRETTLVLKSSEPDLSHAQGKDSPTFLRPSLPNLP